MEKTKEKGITLIALVITIVVLLILSGVTIKMLTGRNGILTQTNNAKQMSSVSNEKEAIQLNITFANMKKVLDYTNKYYIGEELVDKTLENGDKWNIVVNNDTLEQYGTGYNYIKKGTEILNYGETQYEWLVNYNSGEVIQLDSKYTNLSYKTGLAVTDNLVLNIDATNFENNNWGNVIKYGDVKYSEENKALYFDGDGDYLELAKSADFKNGFTFEIYANLERLLYYNSSNEIGSGIFCKMPNLNTNFTQSMRFGYADGGLICKLNQTSSWNGNGDKLKTSSAICTIDESCGYEVNKDFYLTVVYRRYDENNPQWKEKADKFEYYIDGKLYRVYLLWNR